MLTEIIVYIALFSALFSGAFATAFQTVDAIRYLQDQKNAIDGLYFLQSRLDTFIQLNSNWQNITEEAVDATVSGSELAIKFISSQIIETATSSSKVLLITLEVDKKTYTFSYVQ